LRAGQRFEVAPGQTLAVESRLEAVAAEFSLASINGESAPRVFQPGQRVPAGAVLLSRSAIAVEALQPWGESLLSRLLRPVEREADRDPVLERIIRGYLAGIFVIAIGSGVVWALLSGDAARTWSVVTAVLVVSCPCAIGLAVPLAGEMAIVALRRRGVFVRESGVFARLGRIRRVIFDKTGTLTLEAPILRAPEMLVALPAEVQGALLTLVSDNPHPVAQALAGMHAHGPRLNWSALPYTDQNGFDEMLWACDLNFVRGEDSLVRALWAGQPFVWHIYPQDDHAHHAKLEAFLDWMQAPESLKQLHRIWNGLTAKDGVQIDRLLLSEWDRCVKHAQHRLSRHTDLASQLVEEVCQKTTPHRLE
jgi:Cu2+-exporting ATPase